MLSKLVRRASYFLINSGLLSLLSVELLIAFERCCEVGEKKRDDKPAGVDFDFCRILDRGGGNHMVTGTIDSLAGKVAGRYFD